MKDDLEARILDVHARATQDAETLSALSPIEQAAFYAGQADRAWMRAGLFALGLVVGVCAVAIAGGFL